MTAVFLERIDLVQLGLVEVLAQICPAQWAYGEPTEDDLPESIFTLTWQTSAPTQTHSRGETVYAISQFDLEVDTSATGRTLAIELNGVPYSVVATDNLPATLRGLLLAAIVADTNAPNVAVTSGLTGLRVTPGLSGSLLSASVTMGRDLVTTETDTEIEPHEVMTTTWNITIPLQAWAPSTMPRLSANRLLAYGQSLLQGPDATQSLLARGCVIRSWDSTTDLTVIASAKWASRSAVNFVLAYDTKLVTPAVLIQSTPVLLEISP